MSIFPPFSVAPILPILTREPGLTFKPVSASLRFVTIELNVRLAFRGIARIDYWRTTTTG